MVVGVVSDQVALVGDPSRRRRLRLGPSSLHEERRAHAGVTERVEDVLGVARRAPRPVRMLGVERQRDPKEGPLTHVS